MAADLHIHVFEGITEKDLAHFSATTIGSKYCPLTKLGHDSTKEEWDEANAAADALNQHFGDAYPEIGNTPNVWIGEVSWLKAAIFEDGNTFISSTVQEISDVVGEDLPVLDAAMIERIIAAFELSNATEYKLADAREVRAFLEEHKGKQIFTVSW